MANRRDAGVFKLENGCWAYRFTVKVDGETITRRKTVDDNGLKFRTKTDAIKAREAALQDAIAQRVKKKPTYRHTIKEVFIHLKHRGKERHDTFISTSNTIDNSKKSIGIFQVLLSIFLILR